MLFLLVSSIKRLGSFWLIALHITSGLHSPWERPNERRRSPVTGASVLGAHGEALRLMECRALMA